ncbi:MAG: hypothetical protein ACKVOX_10505 [Rhizobacter sp.]|jgi:hypothetical protein
MIKAMAATEQKISGQIGHPAACMIENTSVLSALWREKTGLARWAIMACTAGHDEVGSGRVRFAAGADFDRRDPVRPTEFRLQDAMSTECVDNFVGKSRPNAETP